MHRSQLRGLDEGENQVWGQGRQESKGKRPATQMETGKAPGFGHSDTLETRTRAVSGAMQAWKGITGDTYRRCKPPQKRKDGRKAKEVSLHRGMRSL